MYDPCHHQVLLGDKVSGCSVHKWVNWILYGIGSHQTDRSQQRSHVTSHHRSGHEISFGKVGYYMDQYYLSKFINTNQKFPLIQFGASQKNFTIFSNRPSDKITSLLRQVLSIQKVSVSRLALFEKTKYNISLSFYCQYKTENITVLLYFCNTACNPPLSSICCHLLVAICSFLVLES